MKEILDYLKANGEYIDSDIANAVGLSLPKPDEPEPKKLKSA